MEGHRSSGWRRALLTGSGVLAAAVVGLLVVPDRLMSFLTTRVSPPIRDLLVLAWVAAWFVALTRGLMVIQRRRGA